MERLTLTPQSHELVINNGSLDGAVDLFSYGAESDESQRQLGSLYVIGHRASDSNNMGYIVSLIASLARREYYAQAGQPPRDAFARMLKKTNEVVDEFFKSAATDLSVGIFAIAGSSIMVSKLDKFKIFLAREGETIDILTNVGLFQKEHVEKRRFSSIISGSLQPGDRILAYYPTKPVTSRERHLKASLTTLNYPEFASKIESLGQQHSSFAAAMLHVDIVQSSEPATSDGSPAPAITVSPAPSVPAATYAWAPRQHTATAVAATQPHPESLQESEPEPEVPRIISTEFALGTRQYFFSKWLRAIHVIRLDSRGKALFLGATALVILAGVLVAKSILFVDPQAQNIQQTLQSVKTDLATAQSNAASDPAGARQTLTRDLATISTAAFQDDKDSRTLAASLVQAMDTLDNAQNGTLSLIAQPSPDTDHLLLASWASASASLWAVSQDSDKTLSAIRIVNNTADQRTALTQLQPSAVIPFQSGILVLDAAAKNIIRVTNQSTKTFAVPTQDTIISASLYADNLYLLTDHAILKVSDLDTDKPVTKQWLTNISDLAPGASDLIVDGSVRTFGHDGMLTTYYKGERSNQVQTPLEPSGTWHLLAGPQDGQLAIASNDTKRVYLIDTKDGSLVRTLKVDTEQTITQMFTGPDGSLLLITKDNKIWKVQ